MHGVVRRAEDAIDELDGDFPETPDVSWRTVSLPGHNLRSKLSVHNVEPLRDLKAVLLQAECEIKTYDLHRDGAQLTCVRVVRRSCF